MKDFDELLREDIAQYEGRHDDLIFQAPALYRLLVGLLDDPRLPFQHRKLLIAAIAYFILPVDVIPEEFEGPYGYIDDIFFCAWVANEVMKEVGNGIVEENWDGECPLIPLIQDILNREQELPGDLKKKILAYVGIG